MIFGDELLLSLAEAVTEVNATVLFALQLRALGLQEILKSKCLRKLTISRHYGADFGEFYFQVGAQLCCKLLLLAPRVLHELFGALPLMRDLPCGKVALPGLSVARQFGHVLWGEILKNSKPYYVCCIGSL
jgi:hypothetical protein